MHPFGKLDTPERLADHLERLLGIDPRLAIVAERAGPVELRRRAPGFAGLAHVICGQQLSVASANAIWTRFAALPGALDPAGFLALGDEQIRRAGFSAAKLATLRGVAAAMLDGRLDFAEIDALPASDAIASLGTLRGIGPWTAELYLMFCAAHPDIFPAGDLALQKAVQHGLGLASRPSGRELAALSAAWSPHRATAALLFWRYFAIVNRRDGVLIAT